MPREAQEASALRAAEAAREAERLRLQREAEERQTAADLRAIEVAQASLRQKAEEERRQAQAAQAIEAAQEAERHRLRHEATQAFLQRQAEEKLREDRATKAAEAARKRQEEAENKSVAEQRAPDETAAVLQKKQEDLDLTLTLSLEEVHGEAQVDRLSQDALTTSESGMTPQLLQEFKRLQDSVEQHEAAAILASEQRDEASPITRDGGQADIGILKTQSPSCSQDGDDTDELFFDAPEIAAPMHRSLVDQNLVQKHLANTAEDWSDRAVMNSPLHAPMP